MQVDAHNKMRPLSNYNEKKGFEKKTSTSKSKVIEKMFQMVIENSRKTISPIVVIPLHFKITAKEKKNKIKLALEEDFD